MVYDFIWFFLGLYTSLEGVYDGCLDVCGFSFVAIMGVDVCLYFYYIWLGMYLFRED